MPKVSRPTLAPRPSPGPAVKTTTVLHRRVKNERLATVSYTWAFVALTASPGARAHYDGAEPTGTGTPPPSATCSAGSYAASITAWPLASATTKPSPSPTRRQDTHRRSLATRPHRMSSSHQGFCPRRDDAHRGDHGAETAARLPVVRRVLVNTCSPIRLTGHTGHSASSRLRERVPGHRPST